MPPSSWTMLSDSESSSHDETQAQTHDNDNDVNQHHSQFHFISNQIQQIITQISDVLRQVQQRKGQQLIIGYNYKMDCDISQNNDNSIISNAAESDSSPDWNIVTTPKTSSVDRVLENWKYQGQDLQDDGLFLSYIDLTLETFNDLERVTNLLVEIGAKYVDNMRENLKTAAGFDILFDNMGKIRAALEELCVATTDAVDNIGEDNDVKNNMDQLMECYRNVCEKLPVSLKMEGKCDVAGTGVSMDILGDDDDEEEKEVLDIGDYSNLELDETMNYHSNDVYDLKAYSIDGIDYVASCSDDKTVKILRLEDRSVVATLEGHSSYVKSIELYKKRDGTQCLASCGGDGCIKLWNLHSNTLITTLQSPNGIIALCLAHFVKDDKPYLVYGYGNGDTVVWDLESRNVVTTLKGHSGRVRALDVMEKNNKQYLVSAGDDGKIRVWNLETYELVKAINNAHDNAIWSLTYFVYDGKVCIASGGNEGRIKIWDAENYSLVSTLEGHSFRVKDIKVCQSGGVTMLASASSDYSIKFWRLDDMSLSHTLKSTIGVWCLEFVKDVDDKMMMISCGNGYNISSWKEQEN